MAQSKAQKGKKIKVKTQSSRTLQTRQAQQTLVRRLCTTVAILAT